MSNRKIQSAEKLAILADAVMSSAPEAADRGGVSAHAVWKWAEDFGGLRAVRELYESRQLGAVSEIATSVSKETRRRMGRLPSKSLVALGISLIESAAKHNSAGVAVTVNANANASAASAAGSVSAAEAAYIAALRGQPSTEGGESAELPAVQVSGNGAGGPEPAADHQ